MIRRLVGNDERVDVNNEPLDVDDGDTIFLHHTIQAQKNMGYVLGPFVAVGDAQMNIEQNAWKHLGNFNWQVRIDWEDTVYSLAVEDLHDKDSPIDFPPYAQALSEVQGLYLEGQLKKSSAVISEP